MIAIVSHCICSTFIDLAQNMHFVYSKLNLRPKNSLQEIGASNFQHSNSNFAQNCNGPHGPFDQVHWGAGKTPEIDL